MKLARPLAALAALGLAGGSAHAQSAKPVPGCAGSQITDEKGDVSAAAGPTATNLDITGGFFLTDAKGLVTANLQINDMSLTPPPPATAVSWYTTWIVGSTTYYVSMETDVTGAQTFEHGTYGPNAAGTGDAYTPAGETKGKVVEGPDGVISIEVPKAAKGATGQTLTLPAASSFQLVQNGLGGGVLLFGDETDPEAGTPYAVGACELGTAPAAPAPAPGGPAPAPQPPPAQQPAPALPLTLVTQSVKAKKGVLALKVRASGDLTQIGARVRKGTRALGTGRLAKLASGATGTIKVKARKARKGTYTLDVTGRLADGRLASASFRLKVR